MGNTKARRRAKARHLEVAAWALYCEGHTLAEIAGQHHVTHQAVHKAIKRAIARAMDGLTADIREKKTAQVARLERIAELAMDSYRKSCREATKKTRRSRTAGANRQAFDEAVVTTTEQAGDPRFLDQARGALADIRKILGMDAPTKVAVEQDRPFADVPTADLWAELDALRARVH